MVLSQNLTAALKRIRTQMFAVLLTEFTVSSRGSPEIHSEDEASCTSADAAAARLHDPRCVKTQSGLKHFAVAPGIQISSGCHYADYSSFILLWMRTLKLWIKLGEGGVL